MVPIQKYISEGTNVNNVPLVEMTKIIGTAIFSYRVVTFHFTLYIDFRVFSNVMYEDRKN